MPFHFLESIVYHIIHQIINLGICKSNNIICQIAFTCQATSWAIDIKHLIIFSIRCCYFKQFSAMGTPK